MAFLDTLSPAVASINVNTEDHLVQGSSNLVLEDQCAAEISFNPDQTRLTVIY